MSIVAWKYSPPRTTSGEETVIVTPLAVTVDSRSR